MGCWGGWRRRQVCGAVAVAQLCLAGSHGAVGSLPAGSLGKGHMLAVLHIGDLRVLWA